MSKEILSEALQDCMLHGEKIILHLPLHKYKKLEQDLERLEKLEYRTDKLITKNNELAKKIWDLQEENANLRDNLNTEEYLGVKSEKQLEKYKKVVEILKDKFQLDIEENGYFECIDLDYKSVNNLPKEEHELLKEVFGNKNI